MASGRTTLYSLTRSLLVLVLVVAINGKDAPANQLLLFDSLPPGLANQKEAALDIRSNYSGTVQLVESREFRVVVNITAPTHQDVYNVDASLREFNGRVLLEIKEFKDGTTTVNLVWLFAIIAVTTALVGIITAYHANKWYKQEKQKFDVSDHKSFASSSQRGAVYRPGNSLQMVPLGQGNGEHYVRGEDQEMRNLRCDEELRQVQELPEEEEAEALEMEQLNKLKLKADSELSTGTEDSDPQERNLIKSRFHSQAKTVHKDMINKASSSNKKGVSYKHTQNGTYEGVPTDQDEASNDEVDSDSKVINTTDKSPTFVAADLQVNMNGARNGSRRLNEKQCNLIKSNSEPAYANDPTEVDPTVLVLADVHKSTPGKMEMVSLSKDKPAKPGNLYVSASELLPAVMSTFGPTTTSTPKGQTTNASKVPTTTGTPKVPTTTNTPKGQTTTSTPKVPTTNTSKGPINTSEDSLESSTADIIFNNVARRYQLEAPLFNSDYLSMGDIPEDPREDDQSVSESARSTSMYGSSEIFESTDTTNVNYNFDSDVDVPPLDVDDILSDGGIPSPLGFPMYRAGDSRRVNDDIKLIPGALKSPGTNTGRIVAIRPRPNSSFILNNRSAQDLMDDVSRSAADNETFEESPPLPPPPEDKTQPQTEMIFEFPPPPKFYKPPQHIVWREQQKLDRNESGSTECGQPTMSERDSVTSQPVTRHKGGSNSRGSLLNPTYMNLTILTTLCVLTLVVSAYNGIGYDETRVDITVFAPSHFFTNASRVFFNLNKDTEIVSSKETHVLVYDVSHPLLGTNEKTWKLCFNMSCEQGCDETRGECICLKGFQLGNAGECHDVNECMEGKAKCDKAAGCHNRKGTYDCICGEDYYGNGKTCRECKLKCPDKYYEVEPCLRDQQKMCKACTQFCRPGYYMAQPCSTHENAMCRACRPDCLTGEFESRQCTNFHDRECKNLTNLLPPLTSSNVILEDKRHIKQDQVKLDKLPAHYVGFTRYKLYRGTGIHLELTVRFIDATQQFVPINVAQPFSLDLSAPAVLKSYAVQRYCPTPSPDYYILRYKKLEGVTFKQNDNGSIDACETHKPLGNFPSPEPGANKSFLCSQPGSLTNIFSIDEDFFLARTKWVDKSKRCQRNSRACETCIRKCGTDHMFSSDPTCSVAGTAGEAEDYGDSPRLMMCYNCCVKKNCSTDCKDYHKRKCQPEQCSKGNLLEFTIEPSWDSSQDGRFFCHIAPSPQQHLLELDYSLHSLASSVPLHVSKVRISGDTAWETTGAIFHSDGIIDITINSSIGTVPDFLEGGTNILSNTFKVGTYKSHGSQLGTSVIRPDFVFIRPAEPHGIPPMPGAHQECTHNDLNTMLLASNMENPYIYDQKLLAVANSSVPFIVTNKLHDPVVMATLPRNVSILKKLFAPAVLVGKSFSGDISQNSTHWIISVQGEVTRCPGFLHMSVLDPNYPLQVLFNCDIAVLCPTTFSVSFGLPSHDKLGLHKEVIVTLADEKGENHFRIYRRASVKEKLEEVAEAEDNFKPVISDVPVHYAVKEEKVKNDFSNDEVKEMTNLPLAFPYLLMLAGSVLLLLVLAILGLCFQPTLPVPDTPFARWYHPFFATGYMMFQFAYSAFVSGTVFFLLLTAITNDHVNFVVNHGHSGAVSTASSHIELLQLQRHMEAEISRQDLQADVAQKICMQDMRKIVTDMKKFHQLLLESTKDVFERHRLDLLLSQQKLHVREKLMKDLENFRSSYAKAARSVLRQVNQNALASFQNVQYNNSWLDGARFLHEAVNLLMKAKQKEQKSFMDWTGIKADLAKLEIDLTFSLPPLPRLDDIPVAPPDLPPIKRDSPQQWAERNPIRSIQMHNNWFFPLDESGLGGSISYQQPSSIDEQENSKNGASAFYIFLAMFIVCDVVLLAHRMCKAWIVAKLILFGFPEYFREHKDQDGDDDVFQSKESKSKLSPVNGCKDSPLFQNVKMFFIQTISTTFFPKIVGAVAACALMICLLDFSNKYLTVQELEKAGIYQSTDQHLDLQITMTNARMQTHADYINTVDFPAFQSSMSSYISRHRSVLGVYWKHLKGLQNLTTEMYCGHLKTLGIPGNCSDSVSHKEAKVKAKWNSIAVVTHACQFEPVEAVLFNKIPAEEHQFTERQMEVVLESLRYIIYLTSQLIVIYLFVIVLKELASAVLWILIQRSGVIRLRIIVERDQDDSMH